VDHLPEGQGCHDEEDAFGARRYRAHHEAEKRSADDGRGQREPGVETVGGGHHRKDVGTDAVDRAVAERDHAAIAGDDVEADREDHERCGLDHQLAAVEPGLHGVDDHRREQQQHCGCLEGRLSEHRFRPVQGTGRRA
jgi:hypothetical protein